MNRTFSHIHASGRFNAPVKAFEKSLRHFIEDYDASIITGTECEYETHEDVVKSIEGFASNVASATYADDSFIMWKTDEWAYVSGGSKVLTKYRYHNVRGLLRLPTQAKWIVLQHRLTNRRLLVTVAHLPSSVEGKKGLIAGSVRARAWLDCVKNWKSIRNELYNDHDCDAMLVSADWNLNFFSKITRTLVHNMQRGMHAIPGGEHMPNEGTLGNRLVDFSLTRGKIVRLTGPYVLPETPASDHRPYKEVLRLM